MAPTKRPYDISKNKRTLELMASKLENGDLVEIKVVVLYFNHISDCVMATPLSTMVSGKEAMREWIFTEKVIILA